MIEEELINTFQDRFRDYNSKVLLKFADTINRFNDLSYSEALKLGQILKYDKSIEELIKELSQLTGKSYKDIKKVLEKVAKNNIEFAEVYYQARNMTAPIYEENKALQRLVKSTALVTGNEFKNLSQSTAIRLLDKDGNPLYFDINSAYKEVIDRCIIATVEGKENYLKNIRSTVTQLADSGVRKIYYNNVGKVKEFKSADGRVIDKYETKHPYSQRIDTAIRRNIYDGISKVTMESQKMFGEEFGADGVEITTELNPAPDHEWVQGRQFTLEEFDKFQNDQEAMSLDYMIFPAISEETGHDRRSIGEYNCRHNILSIIVGIDKPIYSSYELSEIIKDNNDKVEFEGKQYTKYEASQLQREIETDIRRNKDNQMMSLKIDDKETALKCQENITKLTTKYRQITNISGLPNRLSTRAGITGYRRVAKSKLM